MPRADARLVAIEEDISRGGMRRGNVPAEARLPADEVVSGLPWRREVAFWLLARNSATAADVEMGFSSLFVTSSSLFVAAGTGFSFGNWSSSPSLL